MAGKAKAGIKPATIKILTKAEIKSKPKPATALVSRKMKLMLKKSDI